MKHNYFIESDRISLHAMTEDESEMYRILRNRKDNIDFFFSGKEITVAEQKTWYERYLNDETQLMFSIYENVGGVFIGGISLYDIDSNKGMAEVGRIIIDRNIAAGKHYGAEAIKLLNSIAKANVNIHSTYANIYNSNLASLKSFYAAGYKDVSEKNGIKNLKIELEEK